MSACACDHARVAGRAEARSAPSLRVLGAALALLPAAAGCRGAPPALADDPDIQALGREMESRRGPEAKRLALAPVEVAYAPTADLEADSSRYPARIDREDLRAAMLAGIEAHTGFKAPLAAGRANLDEAFEEAWAAGAHVLVRPVLPRLDCVFRGRNWRYGPNLFLFFYAWAPSFWVPDEDFAVEGALRLEAYSVASERLLYEREVPLEALWPLDDFERGWSWTGIITAPQTIDEDDWALVSDAMAPLVEGAVARIAALEGGRGLHAYLEGDGFRGKDPTVLALACGVSRHASGLLGPASAGAEAERFAGALERLGVPKKNVRTLVDQQATGAGVEEAVTRFLGRARPADVVVIYWSGLGGVAPAPAPGAGALIGARADRAGPGAGGADAAARPGSAAAGAPEAARWLLPFDADPARLAETGLSLARLRELLSSLPAGRVIVVLDASFGPARARGARSLSPAARPPASEAGLIAFSERRDGKDVTLCVASGPDQDAIDLAAAQRGLFGFLFEEAIGGAADDDKDGRVSTGELIQYVEREVSAQAGLEGVAQRPRLYRLGQRVRAGELYAQGQWLPNLVAGGARRSEASLGLADAAQTVRAAAAPAGR